MYLYVLATDWRLIVLLSQDEMTPLGGYVLKQHVFQGK